MKKGVPTQLNGYLFQTVPNSLEFYLPKDVNSFFNMHWHGRVLLAIRPSGPGSPGKKCQWKGLEISSSSSRKLWFFVFRGLKFHFHRKRKTFVMFLGTFWLQSLCCFALLRKQRSYIVLSKNPSEYTEDVRDSQWKSGTEKLLDHDNSYVMLCPTFAFKMPE